MFNDLSKVGCRIQFILATLMALAIGFLAFAVTFPLGVLNTQNFSWMMDGDPGNQYIAWLFYRSDEWRIPVVGSIQNILVPVGTTTVMSDSIPWFAVVFKFFQKGTVGEFQYFGYWHLLVRLLCALAGIFIGLEILPSLTFAAAASVLFAFSPILAYKLGHAGLIPHWLLLFVLLIGLREMKMRGSWILHFVGLVTLNFLATCTHPYIFVMVFSLSIAVMMIPIFLIGRSAIPRALVQLLTIALVSGLTMYILGYFTPSKPAMGDFGAYNADLLQLLNPWNTSFLLPELRHGWGNYDGFAFLGVGIILILVYFGLTWWRDRSLRVFIHTHRKHVRALLWVGVAMFIFALSKNLTFGGNLILKLDWLYFPLGQIPYIFRASARFMWPVAYLVTIACIWFVSWRWGHKKAPLALWAFTMIQIGDLGPWMLKLRNEAPRFEALVVPAEDYRTVQHAHFYPPVMSEGEKDCPDPTLNSLEFRKLQHWVAVNGWSSNSGLTSRIGSAHFAACREFMEKVASGKVERDGSLFIVQPGAEAKFKEYLQGDWSCRNLSGAAVCMSN